MDISRKLKNLRIKSGLSQEKVAEQLYVSRQAVSKWENGESLPEMDNLVALAKFYNVSVDYLLVSEEEGRKLKPLDAELVDYKEEHTGSSKISKWQKWYTAARCTLAASTLVTIINYILQLCNLNGIPFLSYLAARTPINLLFYGMYYTGRNKEFEEMINSNPGLSYNRQPDIVFYMVLIFTSAIILGYVISVIGSGKNKTGFLAIGLLLWIGDCLYLIGTNLVVYIIAILFGNYSFAQIMQILNFNFFLRYIVEFAILAVLIIGVVCSVKIRKAKRAERKRQAA